jgi:hypothetical protein
MFIDSNRHPVPEVTTHPKHPPWPLTPTMFGLFGSEKMLPQKVYLFGSPSFQNMLTQKFMLTKNLNPFPEKFFWIKPSPTHEPMVTVTPNHPERLQGLIDLTCKSLWTYKIFWLLVHFVAIAEKSYPKKVYLLGSLSFQNMLSQKCRRAKNPKPFPEKFFWGSRSMVKNVGPTIWHPLTIVTLPLHL